MGSSIPVSAAGVLAGLHLLDGLLSHGLRRLVLCPGSRSGPLAIAAAIQESRGLRLYTAIDERSAAFFALGLARGDGKAAAVITTSGSAVANLLPALVEADRSTLPLVLLTADRPAHLKDCGANQTVNQEEFLRPCCRWFHQGAPEGMAAMDALALHNLGRRAMAAASGQTGSFAGPVHLNLPFDEPLHPDGEALSWLQTWQPPHPPDGSSTTPASGGRGPEAWGNVLLDPDQPGVVVAGPWRGAAHTWSSHLDGLNRWQERSGWPLLADALSGLRGLTRGPTVTGYDLLLGTTETPFTTKQVLRLGPLPASRRLQAWLEQQRGQQVLVSEGDPRPQDPLRCIQGQWSGGLASWPGLASVGNGCPAPEASPIAQHWMEQEGRMQELLRSVLERAAGEDPISEPWLARRLGQMLPEGLAVMLANSSPVRDWDSFADPEAPARPIHSFRGASGIDGTLSIACGLAEVRGRLVLVSGDLALQHDSNGWLWRPQLGGALLVVLIDNGGGGIFEQLPIRPSDPGILDFERLFAMPLEVDPCALAAAHGVPSRQVRRRGELEEAVAWGLAQPMALLRVVSDRRADAALRQHLRTMASELIAPP
ncbi:MAG: 2-succinyl-5-enolpyruvyl-6-hydroxy-3-cyclohexene-1-carboxylic-acid synthase [Cyanobium sp.]